MSELATIELPMGVAGFVKVERFVGPIEDGICNGVWDFHNLVLNSGLDYLCELAGPVTLAAGMFKNCSVGSSNTAPAAGQTLLISPLGFVTSASATHSGPTAFPGATPYNEYSVQYDFAVGAIVGNVAEIGIGPGTYNVTSLFSRALVLDGGGSPTVVSVLVTESLRVTYYLRNYIITTDTAGVVTIGGINYNYNIRAAAWNDFTMPITPFPGGWNSVSGQLGNSNIFRAQLNFGGTGIGAPTVAPIAAFSTQTLNTIDLLPANTGGSVGCGTNSIQAYTTGQYYRDNIITIGLTEANSLTGGIGSIVYGGSFGMYQMSFTPKLPKTALNAFALRLRITVSNYP